MFSRTGQLLGIDDRLWILFRSVNILFFFLSISTYQYYRITAEDGCNSMDDKKKYKILEIILHLKLYSLTV